MLTDIRRSSQQRRYPSQQLESVSRPGPASDRVRETQARAVDGSSPFGRAPRVSQLSMSIEAEGNPCVHPPNDLLVVVPCGNRQRELLMHFILIPQTRGVQPLAALGRCGLPLLHLDPLGTWSRLWGTVLLWLQGCGPRCGELWRLRLGRGVLWWLFLGLSDSFRRPLLLSQACRDSIS